MIIDIIIGENLSPKGYMNGLYINRLDMDDITEYKDLVNVIHSNLSEAFAKVEQLNEVVQNIISEFSVLQAELNSNGEPDDTGMIDVKIRELLSTLSFVGYEMYVIRRPDLQTTELTDSTRAYMIDKNDSYFPALSRVVNGSSLTFDNQYDASISTVIIQFLNEIRFSDVVEDAIKLNDYRQKYEVLENSHMGWALNISELETFLNDFGYKFIVVL